jgi:hypothetical protein
VRFRRTQIVVLGALLAVALPGAALAQTDDSAHGQSTIVSPNPPLPGSVPAPVVGGPPPTKPDYYNLSGRVAIAIADRDPKVAETAAKYGKLKAYAEVKEPSTWQIGYYAGDTEVVQVLVDDPTATVRESWTGYQVAWQMARGYPSQFGHLLNSPFVWGALALVFFLGLFDYRRPLKIVHLDLLVLLSFGVSEAYFNAANIGVSVPLAYPPLLYLLGRMLWIGFRGARDGLRPTIPAWVLTVALFFLLGFRIALNIADSGVIDVGYAGVIGADRVTHGDAIYGTFPSDNSFGDTYGPANYFAYIPFELALPWHGGWDDLPAAHAAAIFFDLVTVLGLFVVGRRLARRGRDDDDDHYSGEGGPPPGFVAAAEDEAAVRRSGNALGITLAFAWAAYPFTDYALQSNSNDSLVAACLVWAFVVFSSPVGRGAFLALATMVKFAPLGLFPLFAAGYEGLAERIIGWRPRLWALKSVFVFTAVFIVASALLLAHPAIDPGLADFYDRSLKSQLDRTSPFSVWGQEPSLDWLQTVVRLLAAGLAVLVAFLPRRRSLAQIAALAAAILIAAQLGVDHWFYLYLPWFAGLTFIAMSAPRAPKVVTQLTEPELEASVYR